MVLNRTFHEEIGPYFLVLAAEFLASGSSKVYELTVVYTTRFEQPDTRYQVFCVRNYVQLLIIETLLQKLK